MPRAAGAGAKKGRAPKAHKLPERFPSGEILHQTVLKKKWQLGDVIGQGGFGLIYKAYDVTDGPADLSQPFVIKIEPLENGPLFCELHFYQRVARLENVTEWSKQKKVRYLAVPLFLGTGQHKKGDKQYRFLVLQHLSTDLQKVFEQNARCFSEKTTFSVALRMLDALEFIHDKGYCHADIKAANILLGYNGGKTDFNQVFLVDYGLAWRFLVDGAQKPYKEDPKRAHDGTAEYASRDAHKGVCPSRRGDLEILGYCMLEWLAGSLPWNSCVADKNKVRDLKIKYMNTLPDLFKTCFGSKPCPDGLKKYFNIVSKLAYDEKPDYTQLRQFLRSGMSNEWTLGLSEGASPSKGVKRKVESDDPTTPKKKKRPSSSPSGARQGKARGGSAAKAKAKASAASSSALVNGAKKPTPSKSRSRAKTTAAAKTASTGKTAAAARASPSKRRSPRAAASPSSSEDLIIPGLGKTKAAAAAAKAALAAASPSSSEDLIIPGLGKTKAAAAAAKAALLAAKKKSPAARGGSRKQTPKSKSSASTPSSSRTGSATKAKGKARTPQKRQRNKVVASSESACQTSPGLALLQNGV